MGLPTLLKKGALRPGMGEKQEYLDTFIVKTIEMWHVNAENIFKYFINNYRCLATLICLIDHNNKNPIKL